jgi:hypothetical protein
MRKDKPMSIPSLRSLFDGLSDPLAGQRRGQPLGQTLTLMFLALISGENSERGMQAWMVEQRWRLKGVFGLRNARVPSLRTIQRALAAVDGAELETALHQWAEQVMSAVGAEAWTGIAIDGKAARGSRQDGQATLHVLNVFSQRLGVVLGQRAVADKTNEIPEIRPLLERLVLEGRLVTVDALHTQRETAQVIVEKKGPT